MDGIHHGMETTGIGGTSEAARPARGRGRRGAARPVPVAPADPALLASAYRSALVALRDFLDAVDEPFWSEWVRIDLEDWDAARVVAQPLLVGAPGDRPAPIGLDALRGPRLPAHLVPWAEAILGVLGRHVAELADRIAVFGGMPRRATGTCRRQPAAGASAAPQANADPETEVAREVAAGFLSAGRLDELADLRALASSPEAEAARARRVTAPRTPGPC
jgi:hypothetical protein